MAVSTTYNQMQKQFFFHVICYQEYGIPQAINIAVPVNASLGLEDISYNSYNITPTVKSSNEVTNNILTSNPYSLSHKKCGSYKSMEWTIEVKIITYT